MEQRSIKILEGAATIYRRKPNGPWQVGFKLGAEVYRVSTKQTDVERAKRTAADLYMRARYRFEEGLPPLTTHTFKSVAQHARRELVDAIERGVGKATYRDYIEVIDKWLIPHFGNKPITSIDNAALAEFSAWRQSVMGRTPARSTVTNHISALNRVFDAAVDKGYISRTRVPEMKNDGVKGERRPDFSLDEYRTLYRFMRRWVKQGKRGLITWKREILRDYVLFLVNTGVRPGTETVGLQWRHIRLVLLNGVEYVAITVSGKTGSRELIARHNVIIFLRRLWARNSKVNNVPFRELLTQGSDEYVFALPDGTEVKNLAAPFKILLKECGLLNDSRTGQERVLYSCRHTYISFGLIYHKVDVHTLARQCGTSISMIEKHYSHLTPLLVAPALAGTRK